jgi:2'-5' RNA ligase
MARLFVAVWPPPDVVDALAALPREERPGVRYTSLESWHVTLRFLGEADPDEVTAALAGIDLPPAVARLGPAVRRVTKGVLAVPVDGLDRVAAVVAARTSVIGDAPSPGFVGHLTVARLKPRVRPPGLLGAPIDGQFEVGEVALVESHLDQRGASYETLATWPVG